MTDPIKLMLVEDHKLIRVGIRTLFDEADGYEVIAEAETGREAISKALSNKPDIILLDLGLPDIILSSRNNEDEILKVFSLGVYAYVIKDISTEMLLYIVKTVHEGGMWIDPKIVPVLRDRNEKIVPQKQTSRAMFKNTHSNLTQREYEVLKLVVDGKSNNDIAETLCISEHTAKAHVCNIIQKLLVDDRTQAAVKAIKEGIV